jgi:hypothetical protein
MSKFSLIIFYLFLFNTIKVSGQTVLIDENFNAGFPSGWLLIDHDNLPIFNHPAVNFINDAFVIRDNPDDPNIGDSLLMASSWHATPGQADNYLITPQITLGAFGNYVYFDARSVDLTHPEGLEIRVSVTGTAIEDFFVLDSAYYNLTMSPYWNTYAVSLDSIGVQGQQLYVAFRHIGNDQYLLLLDNIRIETENTVGISSKENQPITLYPNPAREQLYLSGIEHTEEALITDLTGQVIWRGRVQNEIDIQSLATGIYMLTCKGVTQKFVKL